MIILTNSISGIGNLISTSSLTGGCSCKSSNSSSANGFDMAMMSLLRAVSKVNQENNCTLSCQRKGL